ncbi:MAG: tripartite tricarboxylate transporter substrate binding protein [Betaproteobacteria bacterium]|nr:tripartite tricarboxylate transporter substrate binding protein [Betaproteobacteria bacterium]
MPNRVLLAVVGIIAACSFAHAQKFPDRPIKFVVPFPPGGGNDILARATHQKLGDLLGQPVVIDNKPGAGGNIGTEFVAKSAADGYTILIASNQVTINPALGQKLPFDIEKDFAPVALIATVPMLLAVHPSVKAASLAEFIAEVKASPAKFNHSTPGTGTPQHLAFEVLNYMAGMRVTHVPYKGTGPAIADLLGGQVQAAFVTLASIEQHVKAGKVRALAVATPKRSQAVPAVPSVAETLSGYDVALWYSILAPAGTPPDIVARLSTELGKVMALPEIRERLVVQSFEPGHASPSELSETIRRDLAKWQKFIRDTGLKVD